jgi:hypothetical protein
VVRDTSDKSVLLGVLDRWLPPNGNMAGKFLMTTDDGESVHLTVWPVFGTPQPWDEDSPLKPYMTGLDPNAMVDRTVQVIADYKGDREGIDQYWPTQIKVSGGNAQKPAPSPTPKAKAPSPARNTPAEDAPIKPSRSELGQAKGNAITNAATLIASHVQKTGKLPDKSYLEEAVGLLHFTSQLILAERAAPAPSDPMPEEEGPEILVIGLEEDDDDSLGVLSVEDDNAN